MSPAKYLFAAVAGAVLIAQCSATFNADIISTAILFRHGERTPENSYPNLPCTLCDQIGEGQLTRGGSRELYENGVMLRLKYFHLLPDDGFFNIQNMRILSSVPDRTIMSLQSFMAGFLPPPVLDTTLPLYWQPFTFEIDYPGRVVYLKLDYETCPVFYMHMGAAISDPTTEYAAWLAEDQVPIKEFIARIGATISSRNLVDVIGLSDDLKVLKGIDPTMPQWAIDAFHDTFQKYGILVKVGYHLNREMIKIRGGPMLTQIVDNMVAVANNETSAKNVLLFSAHDITVASLAFALGVEDQIPEPISYSDTIMVDLVESGNGEPLVQVVYMDNENTIPRVINLNVPGCGTSCSLTTFRNAVSDMLVEDFDQMCGL